MTITPCPYCGVPLHWVWAGLSHTCKVAEHQDPVCAGWPASGGLDTRHTPMTISGKITTVDRGVLQHTKPTPRGTCQAPAPRAKHGELCGNSYPMNRPNKRFCSGRCALRARERRKRHQEP